MVDYTRDQILGFAEEIKETAVHTEKILQSTYGEAIYPEVIEEIIDEEEVIDEHWQELGEIQSGADQLLSELEDYKVPDSTTASRFDYFPNDVRQTEFERLQQIRNDIVMLVLKYHEEYDMDLPEDWDLEPEERENWRNWEKDDGDIIRDATIID